MVRGTSGAVCLPLRCAAVRGSSDAPRSSRANELGTNYTMPSANCSSKSPVAQVLRRRRLGRRGLPLAIRCYKLGLLSMAKRALITGITGQDGSYLAELLLDKGYEVHGVVRRASAPNFWRIEHLLDRITLQPGRSARPAVADPRRSTTCRPHEFYNLAAMSFVPASWDQPMLTGEFNAQGVTRVLEAVRQVDPDDPLLPGLVERDVRQGARGAADRADAVLSAQPLRRVEGLRRTTSR